MDEEVQMLPPWLIDGVNSAEVFLSNMDYAQVGGAVVVQEVIDGNQNEYLTEVQKKYPERFFCMGMAWTLEEAKANAEEALECTLRSLLDERRPWPAAKTRPNAAKGLYAIPVSPLVECAQGIVKARGRTPAAVIARRMGITPQSYGRLENPRSNLSVRTLEKAAKALGKRLEINLV